MLLLLPQILIMWCWYLKEKINEVYIGCYFNVLWSQILLVKFCLIFVDGRNFRSAPNVRLLIPTKTIKPTSYKEVGFIVILQLTPF